MADREGFEPPEPLRAQRFSRPPQSTTLPPVRLSWIKHRLIDTPVTSLERLKQQKD